MNSERIISDVIRPTLDYMTARFATPFAGVRAEVMITAIALQESALKHRFQVGGPAHGFWQFEHGGGVRGVIHHEKTKNFVPYICRDLAIQYDSDEIYKAISYNDCLACAFARLLLWTDSERLPSVNMAGAYPAWSIYLRTWRPGKPHEDRWEDNWREAGRARLAVVHNLE